MFESNPPRHATRSRRRAGAAGRALTSSDDVTIAARKACAAATLVLADVENNTGDAVFHATLRQGLAVQLEQSPFLSLVSDERVQATLRLMGQPADARLTPQIARQICERTASAAVLQGSVTGIPIR